MPLLAQADAQMEAEIEAQIQQVSSLPYLLREGGLPFLAMGLVLGFVGLILLLKPRSRSTVAIYAFVSLLPGVVATLAVYAACSEFVEMGSSLTPPKPSELFSIIGRAMGRCFFGLLATLIPLLLAIIAFLRVRPDGTDHSAVQ